MTSDERLARMLADLLADMAPVREPDGLVPEILRAARRRRRPRWLALMKEPPMRLSSRVAVGSPIMRLAWLTAASLSLVLAGTAAVALGASLLPDPAPDRLGAGGGLVFGSGGDILAAGPNGEHPVVIIGGGASDHDPWYSHDGTRLAFVRDGADGTAALLVADADGRDPVVLADDFEWAEFAPGDREVVYTHVVDDVMIISIVASDGSRGRRDVPVGPLAPTGWVAWRAGDSGELVFRALDASGRVGLHAVLPDGSGLRAIVTSDIGDTRLAFQDPRLSPDGSLVGYSTWEPNDAGVSDAWAHIVDVDTGADRRDEQFGTPRFSPDGRTLVGEGGAQLLVGPVDGSSPAVPIGPAYPGQRSQGYDFSADGTKVIVTIGDPGVTWIISVRDGTRVETVEPVPTFPDWARPVVTSFERPFAYTIPEGSGLRVEAGPAPEQVAFGVGPERSDTRSLQGESDLRGVGVISVEDAWTHDCSGSGAARRSPVRSDPAGFVEDLASVAGAGVGPVIPAMVDGREAIEVKLTPATARCPNDLHVGGHIEGLSYRFVDLALPSRLLVLDVGGVTVVVDVWARTDEDLAAWMPVAMAFVDSIRFLDTGAR